MAQPESSALLTTLAMECPFCGGTSPQLIDFGSMFWVSCTACNANGPSGNNAEQALENWNWGGHVDR